MRCVIAAATTGHCMGARPSYSSDFYEIVQTFAVTENTTSKDDAGKEFTRIAKHQPWIEASKAQRRKMHF